MEKGKNNEFNVIIRQMRELRDQVERELKDAQVVTGNDDENRKPFTIDPSSQVVCVGYILVNPDGTQLGTKMYCEELFAERAKLCMNDVIAARAATVMPVFRAPLPIETAAGWEDFT